jgi:hypothetical protein
MPRRATKHAAIGLAAGAAALTLGVAGPAAAASTTAALWQMNETSGTTMFDSSGNGNNGTTTDVTMTGAGYVLNGTTSKVVVPDSPTLNPGTQNFSYTVQVQTLRVPPSGTDYDLIRKGISATSGGEFKLEIVNGNNLGKAFCLVKDGTKTSATIKGTTNVADGALHTITCTKTATSLTLTVDSLKPQVKSVALGSISNSSPLTISAKTPTVKGVAGDFYTGLMKNVSVSVG